MQYVYLASAAIISLCLIKIPVTVTAHISLDRQKILSVIRVLGLNLSVKINGDYTEKIGRRNFRLGKGNKEKRKKVSDFKVCIGARL